MELPQEYNSHITDEPKGNEASGIKGLGKKEKHF